MIVVDACTALGWVLPEGDAEYAALDYVSENGALVPGNFQSEIAHGLLGAERQGRITASDVSAALSELLALPLRVELPDPHVVVATARERQLTCYDAAYLALARLSGVQLATNDRRLQSAAAAMNLLWHP